MRNQDVIRVKNDRGGYTSAIPEPRPHVSGRSNRRACKMCGREIRSHKHKMPLGGPWICNLVQMSDGNWVHVSRVKAKEAEGHQVVFKLDES